MAGRELNLLSLDGGGIRGLSSLYILEKLMEAVDPNSPPKPCDYFQMIGGTSTGGLIAILLGRLKMDVRQCIETYRTLASRAFKRKRRIPVGFGGKIRERFDSQELETAVKIVLSEHGYHEDMLFRDADTSCRVFVCATSDGTSAIVPLRSYPSERGSSELYEVTKIWEAARATSAASSFFDPITIGPSNQRFVDGATGANNPVRQLWREAQDVWPSGPLENRIGCIVSIGTGEPSIKKFGKDGLEIVNTLKRLATETEITARDFHQEHTDLDDTNRYFRFNVPQGLSEIGLEEVSESTAIVDATQYYLASEAVRKRVKLCAKALGRKELPKGITASESLPLGHPSRFLALSERPEWKLAMKEDSPYNVFDSISDYEPDRTVQEFIWKRCPDTTKWIVEHKDFNEWLEMRSHPCLWLSGKIGSGKSFTTSTVVEHLTISSSQNHGFVAHFFYRHSNNSKLKADDLFRSYVKQIIGYLEDRCPPDIRNYVKLVYGPKHYRPTFDEIVHRIFIPLSRLLPGMTYVVDGLDECEPAEVQKVLKTFRNVISQKGPRVFISGRDSLDVTNSIIGSVPIFIADRDNRGDVGLFIDWKMEEKMLERQLTDDESVLEEIKSELSRRADRMMLWVSLQLEALWDECFTVHDIRTALRNLPRDLDETYQRCLKRINDAQTRFAPSILRWISVAEKPFTIDQLREALAIDPETGHLNRDKVPTAQNVLKACANLITRDSGDRVLFVHHSVRQFLLERPSGAQFFPNGQDPSIIELELGRLCVAHLTSSDYGLALQPSVKAQQVTFNWSMSDMVSLTESIPSFMRPFLPKANPMQIALPGNSKHRHVTQLPSFFYFAKEQWAPLTRQIQKGDISWDKFQTLALEPNSSYQFHPWRPIGPSLDSHYFGLLGWSVANSHPPLLGLLLDPKIPSPRSDIFNLPLHEYGNLPALHLASITGDSDVVGTLLRICNPMKRDDNHRIALHHAAAAGFPDIAHLLINGETMTAKDSNGEFPLDFALRRKHEATARVLKYYATEELSQIVDDWKGIMKERIGQLLHFGVYPCAVSKRGERQYKIYLFEHILLCCREVPAIRKANPKLQLKGRIYIDNIAEVVSTEEPSSYKLQIFWKGNEGAIDSFIIDFSTKEQMSAWHVALQDRMTYHSVDKFDWMKSEPDHNRTLDHDEKVMDSDPETLLAPSPNDPASQRTLYLRPTRGNSTLPPPEVITVEQHPLSPEHLLDQTSPSHLRVRVHYTSLGTVETILVRPTNISYRMLRDQVDGRLKLHGNVAAIGTDQGKLKYLDEDDYVSIECDEDLKTALQTWKEHQPSGQLSEIELYYMQ